MQVEIPEGTHIHIVVGNPARAFACPGLDPPAALPVLAEAAGGGRATLRLLLKSSLVVLLVAGSFALGHYGGATPAPELTRAAAEPAADHRLSQRRPGRGRRPGPGRVSAAIAAAALGHTATAITAAGHIRPKPVRPGEMMVARQIVGPQEQYERNGAQRLRDIRPLTARLSEGLRSSASGLVLGVAAVGTFLEPAIFDLALPASALYALWVLTRRVKLPLRLPRSAACPDDSNPAPGSRKPKPADGTLFLGWSLDRPRALGNRRRRPPAHRHPRHHRRRQDHSPPQPARQHPRPRLGVCAGRRQGRPRPVRQGAGLGSPLRPRRRRAGAELHGRLRP